MPPINFAPKPETSIVIPTYNRGQCLDRAIESVLAQTYNDWELIVVDDGSQDDTFVVVDRYVQSHPQIRYIKQSNRRVAYARNAGIQASFGQYLGFLDSDDFYKPDYLKSRLDFMKSHPDIQLVHGGLDVGPEPIFVVDLYDKTKMTDIQECVQGGTIFGKRHVFFEIGGFQDLVYNGLSRGEDTDLVNRAAAVFKVEKLMEPRNYCYSRQPGSITLQFAAQVQEGH